MITSMPQLEKETYSAGARLGIHWLCPQQYKDNLLFVIHKIMKKSLIKNPP